MLTKASGEKSGIPFNTSKMEFTYFEYYICNRLNFYPDRGGPIVPDNEISTLLHHANKFWKHKNLYFSVFWHVKERLEITACAYVNHVIRFYTF
jgi:hypothetical protein